MAQRLLKVWYDTELKYFRVFNTDGNEITPIGRVRVSDEWDAPGNYDKRANLVIQAPAEVVNEMPKRDAGS